MSLIPARVFWSEVTVTRGAEGWGVALDGRAVRTPGKLPLVLPTAALADAIAAEWRTQEGEIRPAAMPLTRAANSALEKVRPTRAAVVEMLAGYGETDCLCYRAENPAALVARQRAAWDPWLDWAASDFDARLRTGVGVMFVDQDADALGRLAAAIAAHDDFELTGLHDLVTLSGSLILGLAVSRGALPADAAWEVSRIDETWQEEQWGVDELAATAAAERRAAFLSAAHLLTLVRGHGDEP